MRFAEFVEKVRHRIGPPLPDKLGGAVMVPARFDEAERAVLITVEVLGDCLCGEEAQVLTGRLPEELRGPLTVHGANARYYSLAQFHRRVAEREGASVETARAHASAVMEVVSEAAGEEGLRCLYPMLPEGLVEPPPMTRQN